MNEAEALQRMKAPGARKPGKWREGVIQIHVTRACDRSCYACTQGSNLKGRNPAITLENFEACVRSLRGYHGVVGVFGGNPATHPQFPELCQILADHIPFEQRGLWCNNPMGHGTLMREIFNPQYSNLNVHQSREAFSEFKRDWPESRPVGLQNDSRHSPVFASLLDMGVPESKRWELISGCDINQHWSAMCGQFRGEPRAWFCEIAGAQSMLHQFDPSYPDTGMPVTDGWWRLPMEKFADQVRHHCHQCGVPMRGRGQLANATGEAEQTTKTYLPVFTPKRERAVNVVESPEELGSPLRSMVDYIGNSCR